MVSPRQFPLSKHFLIMLVSSVIIAGLLVSPTTAQEGIDQCLAFGTETQVNLPEVALI